MSQNTGTDYQTLYQIEISRESSSDFTQDAREAIFQAQIEADANDLVRLSGKDLTVSYKTSGKTSLILTAKDPEDFHQLRTMAEYRGYELPDHEEIELPNPQQQDQHRAVLPHSPTEYMFGQTYRPARPDRPLNDHLGRGYEIVGYDLDLERDPALTFRIRFSDGHELHVFPEEIDNTYDSVVTDVPESGRHR